MLKLLAVVLLLAAPSVDAVAQETGQTPEEPEPAIEIEEEVTVVASTRTGRRIEDQPMRVEVLDREEIEEKMLMTPGDIVMMLNEMGGMRVQATSPSLGAASVRIQGMRVATRASSRTACRSTALSPVVSACSRFRRWTSDRSR